jgi:signal transduction histidine kinase
MVFFLPIAADKQEQVMPGDLGLQSVAKGWSPRAYLYGLLAAFNALLWLLLLAFHWEISLRAREVQYFGKQLFPLSAHAVPLSLIYAACAILTLASIGAIFMDRRNLALREKLRILLAQILESLEIGVIVLDRKGYLSLTNESARKLMPRVPPFPGSTHFSQFLEHYPEIRALVASSIEKDEYVRELENNLRSTEESIAVRITTLPLKDRGKKVIGTLLLVNNVCEVVAMEQQVRTAERLSALGTLAAALAHEIRNPLEAMNLNLELLERNVNLPQGQPGAGDKRSKYLAVLGTEVSRLSGILDNFLSFARPSQDPTGKICIDDILKQVVDLIENQAKSRRVEVSFAADGEYTDLFGSEDQLKQVFLNLMINSLEAMPNGGKLSIRKENLAQRNAEPPTIVVRIHDTGEGIPQDKVERLFDPFFTMKPQGIGLGLTIAHRVIQRHRGRIRVESVQGKGSAFTVELPAIERENS